MYQVATVPALLPSLSLVLSLALSLSLSLALRARSLPAPPLPQLKPGLSSYANAPKDAAKSLRPLMDRALKTVPKAMQSTTPIMIGATAGLRLLPDGKADIILDEVRKFLRNYPFVVDGDAVSILSGQSEGAFAWLTLNYLLGNLGTVLNRARRSLVVHSSFTRRSLTRSLARALARSLARQIVRRDGRGDRPRRRLGPGGYLIRRCAPEETPSLFPARSLAGSLAHSFVTIATISASVRHGTQRDQGSAKAGLYHKAEGRREDV